MKQAMLEHGLDVDLIADGEIHRFKAPDDRRPNAWYVYHGDYGAFGHWKTGLKVAWSERRRRTEPYRRERQRAVKKRNVALTHADAAAECRAIWKQATSAMSHPYLARKKVLPHGTRLHGDRLVVPMTCDTHIFSLQYITETMKLFHKGGRVTGLYFPIGRMTNPIWIAEGFATAATVHEVTGDAAVCAFNAGNIVPVVEHFIDMGLTVNIAADADPAGWDAAQKARKAGASYAASPDFHGHPGSDWNDFCLWRGPEHTAEALTGA